ncbi:MAG: hypothetical protein M9939_02235 [Mesorhizobium sp.]|nr:hypothetical protein [Mesorhizobium sp.]MCO5159927.1 hypothetical protein [Mesorhizobium sp.]
MTVLYGYIFTWDGVQGEVEGKKALSEQFFSAVVALRQFKKIADRRGAHSTRWRRFLYESSHALLGEESGGLFDHVWTYKVHFRVNDATGTVIIAAPRYAITDAVVQAINVKLTPNVRRKLINVAELSDHLLSPQAQQFAITYYMADVPGYGSALSTISLHGDDIAAADFLTKERGDFTARQIGVRPLNQRSDCGRFGNTGQIQFRDENLEMLELFLSYTYGHGFYID